MTLVLQAVLGYGAGTLAASALYLALRGELGASWIAALSSWVLLELIREIYRR